MVPLLVPSQPQTSTMVTEKLQKVLARVGLGSRREMEAWIAAGRVSVNGALATLGVRVTESDTITVDGRRVGAARLAGPRLRVLLYHKPVGEICTRSDPEGRRTVLAALPHLRTGRWVTVGRLDVNTSGLLLVTTDGELANRLMHPTARLEREYAVRVLGAVDPEILRRLVQGVPLEDGEARFESVRDAGGQGANHWYHVVLQEGRYREVRRLWEAVGLKVSRLLRIRFADLTLPPRLRPGHWQELEAAQVESLRSRLGLVEAPRPPAARRGLYPHRR